MAPSIELLDRLVRHSLSILGRNGTARARPEQLGHRIVWHTPLEIKLQPKLNHSGSTYRGRDRPERIRCRDVARRWTEARVVEYVERLDPEFGISRTSRREVLRENHIEIRIAGCACHTNGTVAEGAGRRSGKPVMSSHCVTD